MFPKRVLAALSRLKPVRPASDPFHGVFPAFLKRLSRLDNPDVLELGSRARSGNTVREALGTCRYTGLDVHPGPNVDVVGDAHELSKIFPERRFDAVLSVSVFEHLLFPWKVVLEMNRVLRDGGMVFVSTHPNWPAHDLPWDFFRFQAQGFHSLFNRATGFVLEDVKEGVPSRVLPLLLSRSMFWLPAQNMNLGVAAIARKIGPVDERVRWDIPVGEVVDTMYPAPE